MAIRKIGNAYHEIEEVRSRLYLKRWDTIPSDVRSRLHQLKKQIGTPGGDELHRHVIVASIAALQTFHRGTVVSIVGSGDEYRLRAAESVTEKISMKDALNWLSGKTVTFGELVAHSAPCNSVTDLISFLSTLLASDIKQMLAEAIYPLARRNDSESLRRVIDDIDQLFTDLAEAFRLRHIFAHEAAPYLTVNADDCSRILNAVESWVAGVDAVLWATIYRDLPLTQWEIGEQARAEVMEARRKLASAMRKAFRVARTNGTASWLRNNHRAWMNATKGWTKGTYGTLSGSMWPALGASDLARAIQVRAEQVASWNSLRNPEFDGQPRDQWGRTDQLTHTGLSLSHSKKKYPLEPLSIFFAPVVHFFSPDEKDGALLSRYDNARQLRGLSGLARTRHFMQRLPARPRSTP